MWLWTWRKRQLWKVDHQSRMGLIFELALSVIWSRCNGNSAPFHQEYGGRWRKNKDGPLIIVSALCFLQCFDTDGLVDIWPVCGKPCSTNPQRFTSGTSEEEDPRQNQPTQVLLEEQPWNGTGRSCSIVSLQMIFKSQFGTKFQREVPLFLELPKFPTQRRKSHG